MNSKDSLNLITAAYAMIGYCSSLRAETTVSAGYIERLNDHYVRNLEIEMEKFMGDAAGLYSVERTSPTTMDTAAPETAGSTQRPDLDMSEGAAVAAKATCKECLQVRKPVSSGWQPIETALKDGTAIIVCNPAFDPENMAIVTWDNGGWEYAEGQHYAGASHYMPLPKPPEAKP